MSDVSMSWPQYQRGECTVDGQRVYLAPIPFQILSILLIRRGCLISARELADICWPDPDYEPESPEDNIKVHVSRLRKQVFLETDWGRGYRIPLPGERSSKLAA